VSIMIVEEGVRDKHEYGKKKRWYDEKGMKIFTRRWNMREQGIKWGIHGRKKN
jgi:hypothetical protein